MRIVAANHRIVSIIGRKKVVAWSIEELGEKGECDPSIVVDISKISAQAREDFCNLDGGSTLLVGGQRGFALVDLSTITGGQVIYRYSMPIEASETGQFFRMRFTSRGVFTQEQKGVRLWRISAEEQATVPPLIEPAGEERGTLFNAVASDDAKNFVVGDNLGNVRVFHLEQLADGAEDKEAHYLNSANWKPSKIATLKGLVSVSKDEVIGGHVMGGRLIVALEIHNDVCYCLQANGTFTQWSMLLRNQESPTKAKLSSDLASVKMLKIEDTVAMIGGGMKDSDKKKRSDGSMDLKVVAINLA